MTKEFLKPHGFAGRLVEEINPDSVQLQFSRHVTESFEKILDAVRASPHFSPEIKTNLEEASKPCLLTVQTAFEHIAMVCEETMKHVVATGDQRARDALDDLVCQLMIEEPHGRPFRLVKVPVRRR